VTEGAENLMISFEYVNECGEVDTSFAEVTILEQIPLVVPNLPDVYVCPNGSSQVVVNPSGGFPNYHYDWSTGDTTATVIVDQLITYTVTVSDFCGQTAQVSFNGIPAPDPTANVVQDEVFVCLNVDANATATASGGVAPYSYQWTGSNSTNTSATFQFADLGEQTLTVTDACGHTDTDVVMVSPITIQPIVSISPDPIHVCPTSSATTQATASSGTPPYNYAWTGSSTTGTTGTFDAADIGYQFVTVTDNCGFVGNDSVLVILSEILPEVTMIFISVRTLLKRLPQLVLRALLLTHIHGLGQLLKTQLVLSILMMQVGSMLQ